LLSRTNTAINEGSNADGAQGESDAKAAPVNPLLALKKRLDESNKDRDDNFTL